MRKITCISFHGTGSGAVDDFLKEFDNCPSAPSDIECRFLQDPDGISDLEYNLIDNPHRLNSGYALHRYLQFAQNMSHTYKKIFGTQWMEYSEKYVRSLIKEDYLGYWHADILLLNPIQKCLYYLRKGINKLLPSKLQKPGYYNYFPQKHFWHVYVTREEFIKKTQAYVNELCMLLNPDNKEFVLLDQLVATSNITRYLDYVDDLKVIVVDRDPRDLYINQMIAGDHVLPKNPQVFAEVYRDQRKMMGNLGESKQILRVQFEDLIYNYQNTTSVIEKFVGIQEKNHVWKKERFDPNVSMHNTRMWEKYPEYMNAVNVIEKMIPEYLFPFEDMSNEA